MAIAGGEVEGEQGEKLIDSRWLHKQQGMPVWGRIMVRLCDAKAVGLQAAAGDGGTELGPLLAQQALGLGGGAAVVLIVLVGLLVLPVLLPGVILARRGQGDEQADVIGFLGQLLEAAQAHHQLAAADHGIGDRSHHRLQ
ncbi:hypothetical protein D3C84_806130 [compost metagenome]